jgi:hypothetical protein
MRRVVLTPDVSRAAFRDLARMNDWVPYRVAGPDEREPYTETWLAHGGRAVLQYTEDDLLDAVYVVVSGEMTNDVAPLVEAGLPTIAVTDALDQFERTAPGAGRGQPLAHAVIAADPDAVDERLLRALEEALADPVRETRTVAVTGSTYLGWRELDPLLREVSASDPDEDLRRLAEQVLAAIRRHRNGDGP